jgi:hypothetical protein
MKSPLQFIVAIAIMLATATVAAQVYKWVDKDGKVQYSDIPAPADAKGSTPKKLDGRTTSSPASTPPPTPAAANKDAKSAAKDAPKNEPKTLADRVKESDKRRAESIEAAKKSAESERISKANEERCQEATRYLRDLESGRPILTSDAQGERKIVDDDERNAQITRARTAMSESCKK